MRYTMQSFIIALVVLQLRVSYGTILWSGDGDSKEYCLDEEFEAHCMKNELIVMKSALFGRMKTGRCIPDSTDAMFARNRNDPKFLGCYSNVLKLVDDKCTGNQTCTVKIIKEIYQAIEKPCYDTLSGYLLASYTCIAAFEPDRTCTVSATSSAQHLMTSHSSTQSCGSRNQPWKLEAPAGQQINVSLLNFGGAENHRDGECLQYGYIVDREANKNISICGQINERNKIIYHSQSSSLELILNKLELIGAKFFLGIIATGCTDLLPPVGSWLRRRGDEAVVGCYSSRQTWHLNCVNNQWLGVIGNCTREYAIQAEREMIKIAPVLNNEALVTLMIALTGLIICIIIVVCGIVCLKRYSTLRNGHKYGYDCHKDLLRSQNQTLTQVSQQHQSI